MLFLIAVYFPKTDNEHSEMRNQYCTSHLTTSEAFSGLGPILKAGLKYLLTADFLQAFSLLANCPMKIKVSQAQSNMFVLRRHWVRRSEYV